MRAVLVAVFAASLAVVCCAHAPSPSPLDDAGARDPDRDQDAARALAADQARRAIRVVIACQDGVVRGSGSGSGVLLDGTTAITALHVVNCAPSPDNDIADFYIAPILVIGRRADGTALELVPRFVHVERDLARLEAVAPQPALPRLAIAPFRTNTEVCVVAGAPERTRTCGLVLTTRSAPMRGANVHHEATTIHGNSGSGVYDRRGALVGIATRCGGDCSTHDGFASALWPVRGSIEP